jgi:DNA-binding NarL/FixJ family response regulator
MSSHLTYLGMGDHAGPSAGAEAPLLPEFIATVRRVATGGSVLDSSIVSQLVGRRRRDDPLADLTPRERDVLGLMAEGL